VDLHVAHLRARADAPGRLRRPVEDSLDSPDEAPEQFAADRYDYEKVAEQSSKNVYGYAKPWAIGVEIPRCLQLRHGWREERPAP
jgi:hypothetical protein